MPTQWLYGNIYSAIPYVNFTIINKPATMAFLKVGFGGAYIDKQFDTSSTLKIDDLNNNLISQPYNLGIQFGPGLHQKIFFKYRNIA
jgi:hypothetical protein